LALSQKFAKKPKIKSILPTAKIPATLPTAKGCSKCNNTGYRGRIGIFELLKVTPEIQAKILSGASSNEIEQLAVSQGMTTLAQDGIAKVSAGITTLDELLRVIAE